MLAVLIVHVHQLAAAVEPADAVDGGPQPADASCTALPFVFVFFIIHFPAGLIVYWITTNLWTVGQGYILRKRMGPISPPKGDAARARGDTRAATRRARRRLHGALVAAATGRRQADVPSRGRPVELAKSKDARRQPRAGSAKSRAAKPAGAKQGGGHEGEAGAAKSTHAKSGGTSSKQAAAKPSGGRSRGSSKSSAEPAAAPASPPAAARRRHPPRKKKKRSGRRR